MPSFHKRDRATLTWTNEELTEEGALHLCAICLDALDGDTAPTIACGHVFHTVCRTQYLLSRQPEHWVCPVCREQIFVGNAERARLSTPVNAAAGEAVVDADVVPLADVIPSPPHLAAFLDTARRNMDALIAANPNPQLPQNGEEPVLVDASLLRFAIFPRGAGRIAHLRTVEYFISEARIFGMPMTVGGLWDQLLHNRTFFLPNRPTSFQLWQVIIVQNGEQGPIGLLHPGPRNREIRAGDVFTLVPVQSTQGLTHVNNVLPFLVPGVRWWRPWQFLEEQAARVRGGGD